VPLLDSLLSAIVRADGDALVMHVGDRPYVVVGTRTINISTHGLNGDAMTGMLTQLLPADAQLQLQEFGAVEHKVPQQGDDRFTVVAARGGDDIWIEIRRRRMQPAAVATVAAPQPQAVAPAKPESPPEPALIAAAIEQPSTNAPGVVLPMTRTVRSDAPPRTSPRAANGIDRLLRIAAARGASALFLTSDARPWIRIEGDLRHLESEPPLSRADVERAILEIAPEAGHESIGKGEPTEWVAEFHEIGSFRCTTFSDHRGPAVLLRMIATRAATAEQLGLAREVQALATEPQGLVLVAGPRASGKSTLISALVDLVNRQRAEFVITLERQIRLVHDNKAALVSQREIRGGAEDSVAAARAALREGPDVLIVDDLVSAHMVPLLLTAASEGLLIFVSITAPSTADAVQRFIELAPPEMRKAVQSAMAESFRGAVAQVLLKKAGGGLIAAREVLLATSPVTRVISEGQLGQLPLALEGGRKHGMVSFTDALVEYVRAGTVDLREAFRKAPDRNRLLETLKRDGIDTSIVERLA
jgi:twitching motility protein PilT